MSDKELMLYKKLIDRLDAIISVLLEIAHPQGKEISIVNRIVILYNAGLRPIEISKILGISLTHVSVELARIRKSQRKRRKSQRKRR